MIKLVFLQHLLRSRIKHRSAPTFVSRAVSLQAKADEKEKEKHKEKDGKLTVRQTGGSDSVCNYICHHISPIIDVYI